MWQAILKCLHSTRFRKASIGVLATFLVVGILGAGVLPWLVRPWLEERLSTELQRKVSLDRVSFNPYTLKLEADGLQILDRDGSEFVSAEKLLIDAQLSSLWHRAPVIREFAVEKLRVHLVRTGPRQFNFSDLLERKSQEPTAKEAALPAFSLNNIRLVDSAILLDDRVSGHKHELTAFNVSLPFLSTLPYRLDEYVTPAISGKLDGTAFALQGKTKPFAQSRETELALNLDSLSLPRYLEYVPLPDGLALVSGQLSGKLQFVFRESQPPQFLIRGSADLSRFRVDWQGKPLLAFEKFDIAARNIEPLQQRYQLEHVQLSGWQLALQREANGRFPWFAALQPKSELQAASSPASGATGSARPGGQEPLLELAHLQLSGGTVLWLDQVVKPAAEFEISGIQLDARQLANTPGKSANFTLSSTSKQLGNLSAEGEVQFAGLDGHAKLRLEAVQLSALGPYIALVSPASVRSGALAAQARIEFRQGAPASIEQLGVTLSDAKIYLPGSSRPVLDSGVLVLGDSRIDLGKRDILLGKLTGEKGSITAQINKEGGVNLLGLLPAGRPQPAAGGGWRFALGEASLQGWSASLEDLRLGKVPPLLLRDIRVGVQDLDLASGKPARVSFAAQGARRGSYKVSGEVTPHPLAANLQLDLANIDLVYGQPFFTRFLNISLASGFASAKGVLKLATSPSITGSYRGSVQVSDFYTLDKISGEDFLKWKTLQLSGINLQVAPLALGVAEISVTDFYSRLILSANGRLNLQDVLVRDGQMTSVTSAQGEASAAIASSVVQAAAGSADKAVAESVVPVTIGKLVFKRGNINYSDLFIKPNYTANLTDMNGLISGLSTDPAVRASLELDGSMDRVAPVHIAGSLNPLAKEIFIDIKGGVKGYDLTAASTYSAKYAGYGIEKGKLSMDVAYFIEKGKLKASNQVFLDQLTLGERVDSPDATKLPVKFALSLLTDRRGQIKLNIPVEGSLDDPQFSVGGLIWQIIGNVLEKVITSPFDALASAFGDGPQLSHVEFAAGTSNLDDAALKSTQRLAEVLQDRPALKLDISGWASADEDAAGLKAARLQENIRVLKVAELGEKAESQETAELAISQEDYARLLTQVYKAGKFAKPKNLIGMSKSLPVAEMEKLILANTVVKDDDLRELAMQRAQKTKAAIKAAGVDEARLFVVKPKIDVSRSDATDGRLTRAQFTLQ